MQKMKKKRKIKDTDYLFLSAYIHAKEPKLINSERLERMLEAKTAEDALKVLEENGWPSAGGVAAADIEKLLSKRRDEVFTEMGRLSPHPDIVDIFRIKYDYHNAKVLIKSQGLGTEGSALLLGAGRIPVKKLREAYIEDKLQGMPEVFVSAIREARDILARTSDPQKADFVLDRAYFEEFTQMSRESGSAFLEGYAKLLIDASNLRSTVRAIRMKKGADFLKQALAPNGTVMPQRILEAYEVPENAVNLYKGTELRQAAENAEQAIKGGRLTEFEKLCDNALTAYVSKAKMAGFNEKPLIGYLCAVENEINAIRIVMTGQISGLKTEEIKERLRRDG